MKRSMVDSFLRKDGGRTALYIVAHAKWQRQHGRQPSETFTGESNPRQSLARAIGELREYFPSRLESVQGIAKRLTLISWLIDENVVAWRNNVKILAPRQPTPTKSSRPTSGR
jgi:hypothetical protein